jgi:hypothetical protein
MKEESMEEEELDRDRECVFVTSPFWKKKNWWKKNIFICLRKRMKI